MRAFGRTRRRRHDSDTYWDDQSTRRRFISKVCTILSIQMAFTVIVASIFAFVEGARLFLLGNLYLVYIASAGCFAISIILCCFGSLARRYPVNYILLILFTIFESIVVSGFAVLYPPDMVLTAAGITLAVCLALTIFALFAPCDFTGCGPYLCVGSLILFILGLLLFFLRSRTLTWIYLCLGLFLFCMYLVYDIQLMVGGRAHKYSEEDYIIAALGIYIDIVAIFIFILQILGMIDED